MRRLSFLSLLALLAVPISGCGGAGNIGEACTSPGSTDDCVAGAICAQDEAPEGSSSDPVWNTYTCRAICATQEQCAGDLECRGVSGSASGRRACQPARVSAP